MTMVSPILFLVQNVTVYSEFKDSEESRSHDLFGVATIVLECATPISRVEYNYYYYPDILPQTGELGLHPNPLSRTQISLTIPEMVVLKPSPLIYPQTYLVPPRDPPDCACSLVPSSTGLAPISLPFNWV